MRAIIIGAGRGMRLKHHTAEIPKTMVEVMGRPMLDWILEALGHAGISPRDVVFIGGYAQAVVQQAYPEFTFVTNHDWQNNNILLSLLCARQYLTGGFLASYADIVYDGAIVEKLVNSPHDITLGCDTHWRRRYLHRSQHPESDAEKLRAVADQVVQISREIPSEQASGEFIGVMKSSAAGANSLLTCFDSAEKLHAGGPFREGRSWEKAYLIDLLQYMLEQSVVMHRADTEGAYMELDTVEDLSFAEQWWRSRPG
jgi:choline kinase